VNEQLRTTDEGYLWVSRALWQEGSRIRSGWSLCDKAGSEDWTAR